MSSAVKLVVRAVDLRLRNVRLRLPFRFGANTLTQCPQLFVRVDADVSGGGAAQGYAAELMVPKWFDKRAEFTPDDNIAHLAQAARQAAEAYTNDLAATAFGLFDRPWAPERKVFGTVRYMSSGNTAKKFKLDGYYEYVERLANPERPRAKRGLFE